MLRLVTARSAAADGSAPVEVSCREQGHDPARWPIALRYVKGSVTAPRPDCDDLKPDKLAELI